MELYKDENWLTEQYWGFNLTAEEMGKVAKVHQATIFDWMRKYKIILRTQCIHIKETHRTCTKCKKRLPLEKFYADNGKKIGYRGTCKECYSLYTHQSHVMDRAAESQRKWLKKPENKKKTLIYMKEYRERPEVKARRARKAKERYHDPEVKPRIKEYTREYRSQKEVKEYRKKWLEGYYARPEVKEHLRAKFRSPEYKKKNNERLREKYKDENVKARIRAQKYKRKEKGYIELWSNPFPEEIEAHFHHVFKGLPFVIPIPLETHRYIGGRASEDAHWSFNQEWIEKIYQIDLNELIQNDEAGLEQDNSSITLEV